MPPGDFGWNRYPRTVDGAWHAIEDLRDAVDGLRESDKIAQAVTDALVKQRRRFFTVPERVIALVLSGTVAVSSLLAAYFSIKGS